MTSYSHYCTRAELDIVDAIDLVNDSTSYHGKGVHEIDKSAVKYLIKTAKFYRNALDDEQIYLIRRMIPFLELKEIKGRVAERLARFMVELEQSFDD